MEFNHEKKSDGIIMRSADNEANGIQVAYNDDFGCDVDSEVTYTCPREPSAARNLS